MLRPGILQTSAPPAAYELFVGLYRQQLRYVFRALLRSPMFTIITVATIAIGIGTRTIPDITFHIAIVIALMSGLVVTARAQKQVGSNPRRR